jgi:hypothetical protein
LNRPQDRYCVKRDCEAITIQLPNACRLLAASVCPMCVEKSLLSGLLTQIGRSSNSGHILACSSAYPAESSNVFGMTNLGPLTHQIWDS